MFNWQRGVSDDLAEIEEDVAGVFGCDRSVDELLELEQFGIVLEALRHQLVKFL